MTIGGGAGFGDGGGRRFHAVFDHRQRFVHHRMLQPVEEETGNRLAQNKGALPIAFERRFYRIEYRIGCRFDPYHLGQGQGVWRLQVMNADEPLGMG